MCPGEGECAGVAGHGGGAGEQVEHGDGRGQCSAGRGRNAHVTGAAPAGAGWWSGVRADGYDGSIWDHHDGFIWLHLGPPVTVRCGPVLRRTEEKGLVRAGAKSSRHATPDDQGGATSRRRSGPNSSRPSQSGRLAGRGGAWWLAGRGLVAGVLAGAGSGAGQDVPAVAGVDGGEAGCRGRECREAGHGAFAAAAFQPCVGGDNAGRAADFKGVGGCAGDQFERPARRVAGQPSRWYSASASPGLAGLARAAETGSSVAGQGGSGTGAASRRRRGGASR